MSHFSVLVVTEDGDHETALAPFCEEAEPDSPYAHRVDRSQDIVDELKAEGKDPHDGALFEQEASDWGFDVEDGNAYAWQANNPKWDWHVLGGRWSAMLPFKRPIKSLIKLGNQRGDFDSEPYPAGKCDACVKSNLDVDAMREESVKRAVEHWTAVDAILRGYPNTLLTMEVMGVDERRAMTPDERTRFFAQPGISELNKITGLFSSLDEVITNYRGGLDEAKRRADRWFLGAHSFLDVDGVWHERGAMGWFGMSDDTMTDNEWSEAFMQLFDGVRHNAWLSMVDCHT